MKKSMLSALIMALMLAAVGVPATAQEKTPKTEFRTELVRLKYVTPQEILTLLRPYQSREGQVSWSPDNEKIVVIRDTPESVAKVLEVIKGIDVKPADILFTVQLVLGSEGGEGKTDESLQGDLVVAELKKLLKYKTFSLLDQNFVRTLDQKHAEILIGKGPEFMITFHRPKFVKDGNLSLIQTEVRLVRLERAAPRDSSQGTPPASSSTEIIQTSLTLKSGEKTVVGVSRLDGGDKGLILILSGKVIE